MPDRFISTSFCGKKPMNHRWYLSGFGAFQQNMDSSCEDPWREGAPRGSCPPSSIPGHLTVFSFVCARDHFLTTLMGCCFANLNKDSLLRRAERVELCCPSPCLIDSSRQAFVERSQ
ncbi:unnamed protein product [Musa acuminata subsp. burmannicoides]